MTSVDDGWTDAADVAAEIERAATPPSDADAVFSPCRTYRYRLDRHLSGPLFANQRVCTFVMLNPSTADEVDDDPTIRRVQGFARREGCTRLVVVNLFALRSTDPDGLHYHDAPVGPDNDAAIRDAVREADLVVCAWGGHEAARERGPAVLSAIREWGAQPMCLGQTRISGAPRHPLYLPKAAPLRRL